MLSRVPAWGKVLASDAADLVQGKVLVCRRVLGMAFASGYFDGLHSAFH